MTTFIFAAVFYERRLQSARLSRATPGSLQKNEDIMTARYWPTAQVARLCLPVFTRDIAFRRKVRLPSRSAQLETFCRAASGHDHSGFLSDHIVKILKDVKNINDLPKAIYGASSRRGRDATLKKMIKSNSKLLSKIRNGEEVEVSSPHTFERRAPGDNRAGGVLGITYAARLSAAKTAETRTRGASTRWPSAIFALRDPSSSRHRLHPLRKRNSSPPSLRSSAASCSPAAALQALRRAPGDNRRRTPGVIIAGRATLRGVRWAH
ncbi:unnamed protein product [Trichogramma brassicae]|uniref:Uncharacterized protein n=1 Tax=Trichogramma brassicae TaxID=86971 RepID=A0A6H5IP47_9HYME|nr:unnamed protein product [Trichogramma brassicae]